MYLHTLRREKRYALIPWPMVLLCGTGVNEGKAWKVNGRHQIYVYDKEKGESRINSIEDVASGRYFYDFSLKDLSARQTMDLSHEDAEGINVDAKLRIIEKALSIGTEGPYSDY